MDMEPERIDPVSGNEIPLGAVAENVRDDIPAQLSEGEYVVPADVVNYYGVKFFEDLRSEAKEGFQEMAETGRIGGEPMDMPEGDDFPFDMSELEVEDDGQEYNQGGVVYAADGIYAQRGGFDMSEVPSYTAPPPAPSSTSSSIGSVEQAAEAKAGLDTTSRLNRGMYGSQPVTARRFVNERTGQVVTMKGVSVPGSLKLNEMQRDPETGKLTGQSSGPTFQPIDRMGFAYQIPEGFVPLESLSEDSPYYQEGYTPYGFGAGFEGLGEYAQRRKFDPFMSRDAEGNLQGSATVFRNDYAGRPDMQFEGFDRRKGYRDMDLAGLVDSFDERMATGQYEGQAEGRIGAFGGNFGNYETNKILRAAEEDILKIDAQLRSGGLTPEQVQKLRTERAQYAAQLTRMQNILYDKGLDLDADGLEDSFGEKFAAGSAMEENENLDTLRGVAQLVTGFGADDTAEARRIRAKQGKAARQARDKAAPRLQGYMGTTPTYEDEGVGKQVQDLVQGRYANAAAPDAFFNDRFAQAQSIAGNYDATRRAMEEESANRATQRETSQGFNEGGLAFGRSGAITGRTPAFSAYTPGRGTNEYRAALAAQARERVAAKRAAAAATKQGPNVMFRDAMSGQRMPGEEGLPLSEIGGNSGIVGRAEPQFVGYTAPATTPLMRDERLRGQIAAQERQAMRDRFAAQPEPLQPGVADYGTIDRYGVPAEGKPTPHSFQAPDRSAEYRTGYNDGFAAGQRAARSSSTMDAATAGMARGSVSEPTAATAAASYDPIPGAPSTAAYDPVPGLDAAMNTAMFDPIPAAPEAPQRMSMDRATGALPRTTERPSTRFGQDSYYPVQATLSREVATRRARGEDPFINVQDFYDERRAEEERRAARGLIDYLADATEGDITGKTEGTRYTSGERDAEYDRVMAESRALDAADEAYDYGTDKPEYDEETIQRLMAESEARQAAGEQTDMLLQLQAALNAQETMEMNTAIEGALDTLEKQLDDQ